MCKLTWDTVYQQAAFNAWGARRVSSSSINKRVGGSSRAGVGRTWRESTSDVFGGISELRQARRGKRDAGKPHLNGGGTKSASLPRRHRGRRHQPTCAFRHQTKNSQMRLLFLPLFPNPKRVLFCKKRACERSASSCPPRARARAAPAAYRAPHTTHVLLVPGPRRQLQNRDSRSPAEIRLRRSAGP